MAYDFSLSELENSEEFLQSPPEIQQALSREYVSQNGPDDALKQYNEAISDPEYQSLKPEQQDLFKKSYSDFYGIDLPLEDVSFGTDVKDVVLSGLAGTSSIPKAAATVAGWFGAQGSKEALLDIAKTTEDFYKSGISKQGKEVESQAFLSDKAGQWFGDNAIKKVFMVSAESLPLMIATAPIGGAASTAISKAKFLPQFIRAVEGGSKVGKWSHNLITYGASEAGTSALVSAADAGEKIAKMPDSVIAKSPVYQELLKQGMNPDEARAELRGIVEEETVKTQFAATLAGSALSPGGAMTKLFQKGKAGIVKEGVEGVVSEGLQEAGQSGLEQAGENLTTQRNINPLQSLTENVGEATALGAASGGLMGGGMGAGSKLLTVGEAQQIAKDIPLGADPEETAAQIETAINPTGAPQITLGELTPDEIEGIAATQQKLSTSDTAEIQRIQRDVLPLIREKNPLVAPHIERIVTERAKALQSQQAADFERVVPKAEEELGAMQPDIAVDDLMDDMIDSEVDVQVQADTRGRSVRFERLKQQMADRMLALDELETNRTGLPSTAEQAAEVIAKEEPTEAMREVEARAKRQEDIEAAFADQNALVPSNIRDAVAKMESDLNQGQANGVIVEGQGNDASVVGGFPSTNPEWFKNENIKKFDQENGTSFAGKVNRANISGALKKVRSGQSLDSNKGERAAWEYIRKAAEVEATRDPELAASREYSKLEKQGFEFDSPKTVPVGNLKQGDEVVVLGNNGVPDKLTNKGRDKQGNIVLQDGVRMEVDEFDTIKNVIAQKEATNDTVQANRDQDTPQTTKTTDAQGTPQPAQAGTGEVAETAEPSSPAVTSKVRYEGEGVGGHSYTILEGPAKGATFTSPTTEQEDIDAYAAKAVSRFKPPAASPPAGETRGATSPGPSSSRPEVVSNAKSIVNGEGVNLKPTEGQKQAENYKTAKVNIDGLNLSIENPVGSTRSGKDEGGKEWSQKMKADYGRILGSKGRDKDHVDIFVNPGYPGGAADVFVVNQYRSDGTFDEHKAVIGPTTEQEALDLYNSNYEKGWTGGKSVTRVPLETFKKWVSGVGPSKGPLVRRGTLVADGKRQAVEPVAEQKKKIIAKAQGGKLDDTLEAAAFHDSPNSFGKLSDDKVISGNKPKLSAATDPGKGADFNRTFPSRGEIVDTLKTHHLVKLREKVKKIFVVGSFANNKENEQSDIDILIEVARRGGETEQELTNRYRRKIQNYFVKNKITGKADEIHPQWNGRRIDVYFTYDASNESRPKVELLPSELPSASKKTRQIDIDEGDTDILESPTTRRQFIQQGGALIAWAATGGDIVSAAPVSFNEAIRAEGQTVRGALQNIKENSSSERFKTMAEDLLTLLPDDSRITLTVTEAKTNAAGTAKTDRKAGKISITLFGDGLNEATLLHEAWHAAVLSRYDMLNYYLANPGKFGKHNAEAALKQYRAVWEEFRREVEKQSGDIPHWLRVPAEKPDEFLTYALTNQDTIDWMSTHEYRGRTLRERFLEAIRGFFARVFRRAPTWLDAANMATSDLIEAMRKDAPNFEASARILELVGKEKTDDIAKAAREIKNEPAFKKWFAGSKVVDDDGDPLVVYHGTTNVKEITEQGFKKGWTNFSDSEQIADSYQEWKRGSTPGTIPVYIRALNPGYFDAEGKKYTEIGHKIYRAASDAERSGHDSFIVKNVRDNYDSSVEVQPHTIFITFSQTQIKSIFNKGMWDIANPNILESSLYAQAPATSTKPDLIDRLNLSDTWERFIYGVIDTNDPRRRVLSRAQVVNMSENLSENTDILTIERLRGKKTAEESLRFWEDKVVPLLKKLATAKLAPADLDEYSHAMHAPERNKRMQQVNAKGYIDRISEHLNSSERQALDDEIIDIRSDVLMTGGTRSDRQDRYLQVLDGLMTGIAAQRADLAAEEQRRLTNRQFTSTELAKGTPANIRAELDARSRHLDEIEKIRDRWELESPRFAGITDQEANDIVTRWQSDQRFPALQAAHATLLEFGQQKLDILRESGQLTDVEYRSLVDGYKYYVPLHRDVETDDRPATGRVTGPTGSPIKVAKGSMLEVVHILAHSIQNVQTAINRKHKADAGRVLYNFVVANPDAGITVGKQKKEPRHDSEGNVVMYTAPREADNELYIRVDGERYTLTFDTKNATTKRFLQSIKDADANLSGPMQALGKMVRLLAMVNTTLSPEFIISNFARDIQTAGIHMQDTEAKGLQGRVLKNVFPAIKGILGAEYGKADTHWGRIYRDFAANGGKIGWMQSYDGIKDLAAQIESESKLYREGHVTKKSLRVIGDAITRTNTAVENGVRLAFYDQMIKAGATPSRAALTASNLTVDFTRRGSYSPAINALYMFFNAGVQGNVRMIKAMVRSSKVRALSGGIVLTGLALQFLAYATGGDDETGQPYIDGIPDFIRERNMIFMKPGADGEYFKIPMPYGYNGFFNIGAEIARAIHDNATGRKYEPGKGAMRVVNTILGTFNPLQSATVAQALSPTVLDPFVMVAENKTWSGSDLMPKESPFGPNKADAYRTWKSTPPIIKSIAQGLHRLTGGKGEYDNKAAIDVSPETIEMMYETFTGSAGRFVKDMIATPTQMLTSDEPVDPSKVPFVRKVYGKWSPRSTANRYYEQAEQVERFRKDYLAATPEMRKELTSDPRYKMVKYTRETEKILDKLREYKNKAEAAGRPTKLIEEKILQLQTEYLKRGTL